jgi:protein involved in polysaccharide export with SLBB domain
MGRAALAAEQDHRRHEEDAQVEPQRGVADVELVELFLLGWRQEHAAIDLGPTGEPSLSRDFQIGFVSLPLAGTVKAVGLTQEELERALVQKYASQYLKNPKVTVSVAEYRPFYIIGEVEHPSSFPYTSGLNALSALAIAGGPTYRASKSTLLIQHPGEPALKEYAMDAAVPILPGDIIKVPQRYF